MSDIVTHITVNGDRKLRDATDAAHKRGYNAGYNARLADEAAARRTDTRVTAWSVGGNDDDTVSIHITGNQLDAEEAHDIAAALWHQVNVIQNRRAR